MSYINYIKKNIPFLFHYIRSFIFLRQLLFDPKNLKNNEYWYKKIKKLQINKKNTIFKDRQDEIKKFFKLENRDLIRIYLQYGFPNTDKFKNKLENFFDNRQKDDKSLTKAYNESAFFYSLRLMMHYTRYSMIIPYMNEILKRDVKKLNVLDYGCGVSDIGLLFASLGSNVTIADLDDKKFEFCIWRYKIRGFKPNIIKIKNTEHYPNLKKENYDLIIATELFEHVRNPLKLLKNFNKALKKEGFLFDSRGGKFKEDVEIKGDHLEEAVKIGKSKEYEKFYKKHFIKVKNFDCLFIKIK